MKIIIEVAGKHYFAPSISKQDEQGNPLPLFKIGSKEYYISKTTLSVVEISEIGTNKIVLSTSMDDACKRVLNKINNV